MLVVAFVFGGLFACSTFPLLFGAPRPPVVSETTPSVDVGVGVCNNESSEELGRLRVLVAQNKAEIKYLTEMSAALQSAIKSYEPPKCTSPQVIEKGFKDLFEQQKQLEDSVGDVRQQLQAVSGSHNSTTIGMLNSGDAKYEQLQYTLTSLAANIDNVSALIGSYRPEAYLVELMHDVSVGVLNEVAQLDQRITATKSDETTELSALRVLVSNFSCPEPVVPIVLPPIIVNHTVTVPTVAEASLPVVSATAMNAPRAPPMECVNITAAQHIVHQLVTTSTKQLVENLTDQLSVTSGEAAAALRSAVSDIATNAVEEFLHESTRLHDFDTQTSSCTVPVADAGHKTLSGKGDESLQRRRDAARNHTVDGIPELDFALLSAGSRVMHDRTSKTYFPAQWKLDQQVGGALAWAGMPSAVVQGAKDAVASVSSGQEVYEALNLHKSVGRPEDVLIDDTRPGACWPMQGASGNFTVRMPGSVVIDSISIDHAAVVK